MADISRAPRIAVIGGGAAGLMAAITARELGSDVTLYEKNDRLALKLGITGKGRCNVTNFCTREDFFENVPTNPRFLYSAYSGFDCNATMDFFESRGVHLKVERGNRVFPVSDKASDIVFALKNSLDCEVVREKVLRIEKLGDRVGAVVTASGEREFDSVIVCTGGKSYPRTGSDGDGYRFAKELGLEVKPILPSLVPIKIKEKFCAEMQGLSLRNVALSVISPSGKVVYGDFGEMMFTHFGITGPMVLSASSKVPEIATAEHTIEIDLKPALDEKTLDARLLFDFGKYKNRDFGNALCDLLPTKMIPVAIEVSGIDPEKKVNEITKSERASLLSTLKHFKMSTDGFASVAEAIVTKGGVAVGELNPGTMESKKVPGLYFAGEVIDVDAYTGGFNLQIAFCTAVCAARAASRRNVRE